MPARSKTSPTKTRSGGSSPRHRENPKKLTSQDPDATTVADERLDDEQWLASRPVRQTLADPTEFDKEALLWRHTFPASERMIRRIEARRSDLLKEVENVDTRYSLALTELITFPHPDAWYTCPSCEGTGKGKPRFCGECGGVGYGYLTWMQRP
jgi:hypothetical protein